MPKYNNTCKVCGKRIETYMSDKLVCSQECRKVANRIYAKEFMHKKRQGQKRVCIRCKNEFVFYYPDKNVCSVCNAKEILN